MNRSHVLIWCAACLLGACGTSAGTGAPTGNADVCSGSSPETPCAALSELQLPASLPAARGNSHAEDSNAAVFGFHVFFDSRFSANQSVRCETCHSVDYAFSDNQPTPAGGLGTGARNAPTILNAARYTTFLWDGRADTLWSQPLFALENPAEMGFTRLEIAHLLVTLYQKEYSKAFEPLPDLSDLTRFPAKGAPGDAAFDQMSSDDQTTINGVVANLGKALEAYMRKIASGPSPVDRFLGGSTDALTEQQSHGMHVFANAGCLNCHSGPQLSDNEFHNLGVPAATDGTPDQGRSGAIAILEKNPFNSSGPFFEGTPEPSEDLTPVLGGFRTPSLRNLPKSAPYGHNGTFPTLESIVDFHLQGGGQADQGFVGTVDPLLKPRTLSDEDRAALIEFLKALEGDYPALPWGQWPNGNG